MFKTTISNRKFCPQSLLKHSVGHVQAIAIQFERFFPHIFCRKTGGTPVYPGAFPGRTLFSERPCNFKKNMIFSICVLFFLVFPWVFLFLQSFLTVLHYFHCFFYVFPWVSTIFRIFFSLKWLQHNKDL